MFNVQVPLSAVNGMHLAVELFSY